MTTFSQAERHALSDLLDELGPDAPTLCEGWTTLDLAAHLVVRERRPDSGPGLLISPLAGWTDRVRQRRARQPYGELVSLVRDGPPPWSMFALPGMDASVNANEYFVHHEDVRRAQPDWEPRDIAPEDRQQMWKRLLGSGRMLFRTVPVGIVLRRTDGPEPEEAAVRKGTPVVTISGPVPELTLYATGRRDHARVDVTGPEDALSRLTEANLGL